MRIPRGYRLGKRAYGRLARGALRLQKRFPPSVYGRAYIRRGTPTSLDMFGASASAASPPQQALRKQLHFSGKGRYSGMGAYTAVGGAPMHPAPQGIARFVGDDTLESEHVFTRTEWIADIFAPSALGMGSTSFSLQTFKINPGIEESFPWLSQVAQNYEEYELHQLAYSFQSTVTDSVSSTGNVGSLIMCTQYNNLAPKLINERAMELTAGSCSDRITNSMVQAVECDPAKLSGPRGKYVRSGALPVGADLNSYDHGILNIATNGLPATYAGQQVGKLYVAYKVVLRKPKIAVSAGDSIDQDVFVQPTPQAGTTTSITPITDNGWVTPFVPLTGANTLLQGQQNNIGCVLSSGVGAVAGTPMLPTQRWTKILFPPDYVGLLEVKIRLMSGQTDTVGGAAGQTAGIPWIYYMTGNVGPVYDIPTVEAVTGQQWIDNERTQQYTVPDFRVTTFRFHVQVDKKTTLLDNAVYYCTGFGNTATVNWVPSVACDLATMVITEMNPLFAVNPGAAGAGPKAELALVSVNNPSGGVVDIGI